MVGHNSESSYTSDSTSSSSSSCASSTSIGTSSSSSDGPSFVGSAAYWSTDAILARNAERMTAVSGPPNASILYEPKRVFTPYISLGPVIGMVTESTARILVEVSTTSVLKCFLTDKLGVQHGMQMRCVRAKPAVFEFAELRRGTYYKVTFDVPVPGLIKSGFRTLQHNWSLSKHPARIAAVSTNNFYQKASTDLWKHLYSSCRKSEIDYLLHLGNIVFVDQPGSPYSAYQQAIDLCKNFKSDKNISKAEERVCEIFRNVYREAWSDPSTRHVLANVPNLMILAEHEIKHGLGTSYDSNDQSIHSFINYCAYAVYNEYCRVLFEKLPYPARSTGASVPDAMKIGQCYHFHAFGNLGIIFLDTRAQRTLHQQDWVGSTADSFSPSTSSLLGSKQWSDLEFALSPSGYLHNCKALLVCTSTPIAHSGEPGFFGIKNIQATWNDPQNISEASLLLGKLFDWKASKHGKRNVAILSGSTTDAGVTEIVDLVYRDQGDTSVERIKQITTGPIEALPMRERPTLAHAGYSVTDLGKDHQFKHSNIIQNTRNYAVVDIVDVSGTGPIFTFQHVTGPAAGQITVSKTVKSTDYTSGCWAKSPKNH